MKRLAAAIPDDAFADLQQITDYLKIAPEDFASRVLAKAIERQKARMRIEQHRRGYEQQPMKEGEFDIDVDSLAFPDDWK